MIIAFNKRGLFSEIGVVNHYELLDARETFEILLLIFNLQQTVVAFLLALRIVSAAVPFGVKPGVSFAFGVIEGIL